MILSDIIAMIGAIMHVIPVGWIYLSICRIVGGYGTSALFTLVPMLFSEQVKPNLRGIFTSLFNCFVTIGTFLCNLILLPLIGHD